MSTTPDLPADTPAPPDASPAALGGVDFSVRAQPPRLGPALFVVALVVIVTIGGVLLAVLPSSRPASPPVGKAASGIAAVSARSVIARIESGGEPPPDVVNALVIPQASSVRTVNGPAGDVDLYDANVTLNVPDKDSDVVAFYKSELKSHHWKVQRVDATADGKGSEIFATIPSRDGFYWEAGVVVEPANPSITPALAGASATASSSVELRIFEVDDEG